MKQYALRRSVVTTSVAILAFLTILPAPACVKTQASVSKAAFTYTSHCNGPIGPCTATFTNTSSGAVSYWWSFGDDSTSVQPNPMHVYTVRSGYFTVTLDAIGQDNESRITQTINLYE